jgi:hypothetical protein
VLDDPCVNLVGGTPVNGTTSGWSGRNKGGTFQVGTLGGRHILGLIPLAQVRKFISCAYPQIANPQFLYE